MKYEYKCLLVFVLGAIVGVSLFAGITYYVNNSYLKKENENVNNSKNKVQNIKIDNTKDYVYDIKYDYSFINEMKDNVIRKYNSTLGESLNFDILETKENSEALKIPFINIDSGSSEKVNNSIKKLYLSYMQKLDKNRLCVEYENGVYIQNCSYYNLTYQVYENKELNVLSLLILHYEYATSSPYHNFWGYTFDLETGNLLNIEELVRKLNISIEKLKELTTKKISDKVEELNELTMNEIGDRIDKLEVGFYDKEESLNYYKNNLNKYYNNEYYESNENGGLIYYINSDGKINIITSLFIPGAQFEYNGFNLQLDN